MSTKGRSLAEVGFVHCGFEEQVARVANTLFRGVPRLVVLRIAIDRLNAEVRCESLQSGTEVFPHIYGPLNLDAVVAVMPLRPSADGIFTFPLPVGRYGCERMTSGTAPGRRISGEPWS
jgi:glutathione S-transferase